MVFKGSPKSKKVLWASILECSYKGSLYQDGLQHRAGGQCSPHSWWVLLPLSHLKGVSHGIQQQET